MADPKQPAAALLPPTSIAAAGTPAPDSLLGLAVAVVVVASLYLGRQVLIPITLAALLSFVLAPLVRLLRRVWLGRVGSVLVAVLAAVGLIALLAGVIGMQIASLADDLPQYRTSIERKVGAVQGFATHGMGVLLRTYARSVQGVSANTPAPPVADPVNGARPIKPMPVEIQDATPSPLMLAQRVLAPVLGPLATVGIILLVAVFLLLQQEDLRDRMIRLFGARDLHRTTTAIDDAANRLSRYFITQLAINAGFGLTIGAGLALIGVPSPVLWGVLGTLLRFVPYIGSFIAAALPVALAAAVVPGWSMMLATIALYVVVEAVVGQVIEPLLYGSSTGLSPFSVVVAAIFWSWLWGPIGLILSTPITLCLVVLGRHVQRLEFLDVLLGDRPALTPVESFYQRMLAGDPDEAQAHAETLLRDRALSSYYDDVAMKGLLLAAQDVERGVLNADKLRLIEVHMHGLIEELDSFADVEPAEPASRNDIIGESALTERRLPRHRLAESAGAAEALRPGWRDGTPILCVAGRLPLDDIAARLLAQLLAKHGIGARIAPHGAASRANIATLDLAGVSMVCVVTLLADNVAPSVRYLLARLRRRLPTACLLVGVWAEGDAVFTDPGLRAAIGADFYAASLRDAVQACVEAARAPEAAADAAA